MPVQGPFSEFAIASDKSLIILFDCLGMGVLCNYESHCAIARLRLNETPFGVEFSPCDTYIAFSTSKSIEIWSLRSKRCTALIKYAEILHNAEKVIFLRWSDDSSHLYVSCAGGKLIVFDVRKKKLIASLNGHSSRVLELISCVDDENGTCLHCITQSGYKFTWKCTLDASGAGCSFEYVQSRKIPKTNNSITSARFFRKMNSTSNDLFLAVAYEAGSISIHDGHDLQCSHNYNILQHAISNISIHPKGTYMAIGSVLHGKFLVWDFSNERILMKQISSNPFATAVSFNSGEDTLIVGNSDGSIKLWNFMTGFCVSTIKVHKGKISDIRSMQRRNAFVSSSYDGSCRMFDIGSNKNFRTMISPNRCPFTSISLDKENTVLFAGIRDPHHICIFSTVDGALLDILCGHVGPITSLAFHSRKNILISSSWDGSVMIWEPFSSLNGRALISHGSECLDIAFRPDGEEVCVAYANGKLQFFDIENEIPKCSIEGSGLLLNRAKLTHSNSGLKHFSSVSYTIDGLCVLACGNTDYVCLYEVLHCILLRKFLLSVPLPISHLNIEKEVRPETFIQDNCRLTFSHEGDRWAICCREGVFLHSRDFILDCKIQDDENIIVSGMKYPTSHSFKAALLSGSAKYLFWSVLNTPVLYIPKFVRQLSAKQEQLLVGLIQTELNVSSEFSYFLLTWLLSAFSENIMNGIRKKTKCIFRCRKRCTACFVFAHKFQFT